MNWNPMEMKKNFPVHPSSIPHGGICWRLFGSLWSGLR